MRDMLEAAIERLLGDLVTPALLQRCEAGEWPAALWGALQHAGFALAAAPEARGGAGASWAEVFVVVRAAGRHCLPLPLPETLLANAVLGQCGLDAVSAPLGLGVAGALTIVDGKLSGVLHQVPWGRHVQQVVAISAGPAPRLVLLDRRAGSCSIGEQRHNTAGEPRDDLHFDRALPLASAPLPAGMAADVLYTGAAMLRAAQTAGALQAVQDLTIRYAGERLQFGKPIGSFQALQQQIALLAEHCGAAHVAAECAFAEAFAERADGAPGFALLPIAAARVVGAEAASLAAAVAHTVHGAIGFTHAHALHWSTRRLWSWRSEYGNATVWAQCLGHAVCQGGSAALWPAITSGRMALSTPSHGAPT